MPLPKEIATIVLAKGVDTKTDSKQVVLGRLLALQNGIFTSPRKIRKRYGNAALGTTIEGGGAISGAVGCASYKNELLAFSGSEAYSYAKSTERWSPKGAVVALELAALPIIRNSYQQVTPDSAWHPSGMNLFTWEDSRGGARFSILDSETGQVIVQDSQIASTATRPKPFALGNYFVILYVDSSTNHLRYISIAVNTPSQAASPQDLSNTVNASNPKFDATLLGSRLFVAYNNSDVGNGISVFYLNSFLTVSNTVDVTGESASGCVSIFADSALAQVWIAYYNGTKVRTFVRDYTLGTAVMAPTDVETIANIVRLTGSAGNGSATIYYHAAPGGTSYPNDYVKKASASTASGITSTAVFLRSVGIAAKPFAYEGDTYITLVYGGTQQPTYFVANSSGTIVARVASGVASATRAKSLVPEMNSVGSGKFSFAYLIVDELTTVTGVVVTQSGVQAGTLDFESPNTYSRAVQANELHVSGGQLWMYDGNSFVEHGFHVYPEGLSATPSSTGGNISGGSTSPGLSFEYWGVYAWMDAQGQIHRSAPSVGVTVTIANGVSTGSVALTFPTLRLTSKRAPRGPVMLEIYRTQGNGTVPYLVTSPTSPLLNDPTVDTVSFTDTMSDTTLVGNALLYTTGGVIENIAAPAVSFVSTFGNRVLLFPSENKKQVLFSKEVVPGAPVEFSDLLSFNVNPRGDDLVCGIQMDDKYILFQDSDILFMTGEGPDATGGQNDYTQPLSIAAAVSCNNSRSIVRTDDGIMFQSSKGIYLLTRGLSTVYIGADVEAYNGDTVVSATLIPDTTQVRFCLSSGVALVYDYNAKDERGFGQWSVFTNHAAVDATVWEGLFTFAQSSGLVLQETPGQFTDNGSFIKLRLVTSWLSIAGLQSFQRAYRLMVLGDYIGPHKLAIQVAYDFNPNFTQQQVVDAATLLSTPAYGEDAEYGDTAVYGGAFPEYEFELHLKQQKCTAIQISLEDVQSSNFGEGMSLSALSLQVGVKQGWNKLPAARRFG